MFILRNSGLEESAEVDIEGVICFHCGVLVALEGCAVAWVGDGVTGIGSEDNSCKEFGCVARENS